MRNTFYFTLKTLFVFDVFKFLFWFLGHVDKRLVKKAKVDFKIYDITNKQMKYTYSQISQELKIIRQWNLFS